jgi:hypothetical protein
MDRRGNQGENVMKMVSFKVWSVAVLMATGVAGCAQDDAQVGDEPGADVAQESAALSVPALFNAISVSEGDATEWRIDGQGALTKGSAESLFDYPSGKYVQYGSRDTGVNLVWSTSVPVDNAIVFETASREQVVHYGEAVALKLTANGNKYLVYAERPSGINLRWSVNPTYEWEVRGGTLGEVVPRGTRVQLFNRMRGEDVVYCSRRCGINLDWRPDCKDVPYVGRYDKDYLTDLICN